MNNVMNLERSDTDILILGSGGAGLFAALHARRSAPEDTRITIAAKGLIGKCGCTRMVQGGYNVALSEGDSVEQHFLDTIIGGHWLPNQSMAWRLCELAIERINELENEIGCFFDRNPDGTIHSKAFAGQSVDRTVHKGDLTGIEIINRLMERVLSSGVDRMEDSRAVGLIPSSDGSISGVLFIDIRTGDLRFVRARCVLLATGGGPTMYKYHTPSGDKSMDGLSMALRCGLGLRDMEMVQFHPTGLLAGPDTRMTGTVLEEGLRGAGGWLVDGSGERFMFNYDSRGERATRDIVSRAIYTEMGSSNSATDHSGIFLSMGHLGADFVRDTFGGMTKRCSDCGFDLASGLVEVVPTAHYFMGGVIVDEHTRTSMSGVYVAGEDAGGAHGSNRLGGNGVANSTVFGGVAGDVMASDCSSGVAVFRDPDESILEREISRVLHPFGCPSSDIMSLRRELEDIMWSDVGIIRSRDSLRRGVERLTRLDSELMSTGIPDIDRAYNLTWHDWLNLRSLLDVSYCIAYAGLSREDSRGAHYRSDFPDCGDLERSVFTVIRRYDGLTVKTKRVEFSLIRPGEVMK